MRFTHKKEKKCCAVLAYESIRFSSLFVAGEVSRNVLSDEERGETDAFVGNVWAHLTWKLKNRDALCGLI